MADSFPSSQAEDQETKRSARGPEWIALVGFLGVLAFGLVVIMVALAVSRTRARAEAQGPPAVSLEIPTAREAYVPAVETIRERDVGARLATGVGVWTPTIDTTELAAGRTGWTYFFYLPATGEMASVVVDRGGSTHVAEVEEWETPPDLLDDSLWEVDSSQAVSNLLATCQSFLDENEGAAEVQVRLSAAAEHRRLLWQTQVVLIDDNQVVCEVNVDATTGQVR